jgi:hypothetical protein
MGFEPRQEPGPPHETIPEDKYGSIGVSRFRRTLAWHIARRPGGLVALAVQHGHLRTALSAGYASRSRNGVHDLLDLETALAAADTLASLNEDLTNGAGISGPAARGAINAAQHAPEFAGMIVNARQARALLENPSLTVYESPSAMLMCVYKPDRALCNRITEREAPRLDRCVPSCANIARTDDHAHLMRQEAESLEKQAPKSPAPLAHRLEARASGSVRKPTSTTVPVSFPRRPDEPRVRRTRPHPDGHGTNPRRKTRALQRGPDHRGPRRRSRTASKRAHPAARRPQEPLLSEGACAAGHLAARDASGGRRPG